MQVGEGIDGYTYKTTALRWANLSMYLYNNPEIIGFDNLSVNNHRVFEWLRYLTADRLVRVRELPWANKCMHQSSLIKLTIHMDNLHRVDNFQHFLVIFVTSSAQFSMKYRDNSKNKNRNFFYYFSHSIQHIPHLSWIIWRK